MVLQGTDTAGCFLSLCPCNINPASMVSTITSTTKNGVLIKGAQYVEEMKNLGVMVFDKTGTLKRVKWRLQRSNH